VAVRIYSLAKELKIDSKELVELCARAGIQDKGSALASMTDREVAKLKEFIAGKSRPAERPAAAKPAVKPAAAGTLRREDYIAPAGVVARGGQPEPTPAPPVTEAKAVEPAAPVAKPAVAPAAAAPPPAATPRLRPAEHRQAGAQADIQAGPAACRLAAPGHPLHPGTGGPKA
jgi:translation initiation factor IF-2